MHNHQTAWVKQHLPQRIQVESGERIDTNRKLPGRQLNQSQFWIIGIRADKLGIQSKFVVLGQILTCLFQCRLLLDQYRSCARGWHIPGV